MTRRVGRFEVFPQGLGCMGMSDFYGVRNRDEALATIHRAIDLGVQLLDTADVYGPYTNEQLVGEAIRGRRGDVVIATKFGLVRGDDGSWLGVCGTPEYVRRSCEASLRRLGVDYVDIYYQHRVDPAVPIEETVGAMKKLVEEGLVLELGLSEASGDTLRRANSVHPIAALQSEYSLWTRDPEAQVLQTVRDLGMTFVAYSPIGRGFLAASLLSPDDLVDGDYRRDHPRFQAGNFEKNRTLINPLMEIAARKGVTPAQLALAWVLAQGEDIIPIPGTKKRTYIEENVAAVGIELTSDELTDISLAIAPDSAFGERYPSYRMSDLSK